MVVFKKFIKTILADIMKSSEREVSLLKALGVLYGHISDAKRRSLVALLLLMLVGAGAEVLTIGAIVPLLAIISAPSGSAFDSGLLMGVSALLETDLSENAIYIVTGFFVIAALLSAVVRLALLKASNNFIYGVSYELSLKIYKDTLIQPYSYHTQNNSSEIISSINKIQVVTFQVLAPVAQGIISLVIGFFIIFGLIVVDPIVATVAGFGFTGIYILASVVSRRKLRQNSSVIAKTDGRRVQVMQEGIGGIRDILLDRSQLVFVEAYEQAEAGLRDARIRNAVFAGSPRFIVEALGMVMIAVMAVIVVQRPGGLTEGLPILGALALGAQRLLPMIQQIYAAWASAMGNKSVVADMVHLLNRPAYPVAPPEVALPFQNAIELKNVVYAYPGARVAALNHIDLQIPKGARVGIAGKTGSGKSTLMDVLLGLIEPQSGSICIDGIRLTRENCGEWQQNIAHVPQSIFLTDASIAENIAFGHRAEDVDYDLLRRAASQAELADVIAALPQGYETRVGERGVQLSGGQRQRIGIARALYKQASVLVFDEATSALDTETESAVMEGIEALDRDLTIIIIAHRLSTLDICDVVYRLDRGQVVKSK